MKIDVQEIEPRLAVKTKIFSKFFSILVTTAMMCSASNAALRDLQRGEVGPQTLELEDPLASESEPAIIVAGYQMNDRVRQMRREQRRTRALRDGKRRKSGTNRQRFLRNRTEGIRRTPPRARDTTRPTLSILSPAAEESQSPLGFPVRFIAKDESGLKQLRVKIISHDIGATLARPTKTEDGSWQVFVPARALNPGQQTRVNIVVRDAANNKASQNLIVGIDAANDGGDDTDGTDGSDTDSDSGDDPDGTDGSDTDSDSGDDTDGTDGSDTDSDSGDDTAGTDGNDTDSDSGDDTAGTDGSDTDSDSGDDTAGTDGSDTDSDSGDDTAGTDGSDTGSDSGDDTAGTDGGADDPVDEAGPVINIALPAAGEIGASTGFSVSGQISDDSTIAKTTLTIDDPVLGASVHELNLDADGNFDHFVSGDELTAGETVDITLKAEDELANVSQETRTIEIESNADGSGFDPAATHLLSRITFGATPELLTEVSEQGTAAFIEQQLDPESIDNTALESFLATQNAPQSNGDIQKLTLLRMVSSRRQLQEVLTQFWDNHFNTVIWASSGSQRNTWNYELRENNLFRANALGNFRTLLGISAKSPSMLLYLDNATNMASRPNENYIRELLELHTMGVDGGYTSQDIQAGAAVFSGWHLRNDAFWFNGSEHSFQARRFLGFDIASGGEEQGDRLLDIVARHSATANFICGKLIQLLVSETVPANLRGVCATEFQSATAASDQIARVVRIILSSAEFADAEGVKVKTPIEYLLSVTRNLKAAGNGNDLIGAMWDLDMPLFHMPVPTGFSELGEDFLSPDQFVHRVNWLHRLVYRNISNSAGSVDVLDYFGSRGLVSDEEIVDFLSALAFPGGMSSAERDVALSVLNDGDAFDMQANSAEEKIRRMLGRVFSFPGYQFQ